MKGQHKVNISATMRYALSSEDPEEIDYYRQKKEGMKKDERNGNMVVARTD